jgi:Amt family ammonium transporter
MNTEQAALTVVFTEFYYWVTVVLMFLIHVGFCLYEVGVAREKNAMHTLMKNAMLIPMITVSFFVFGWWIYFAFQNGPGITGGLVQAPWATPWSELMAPHLGGPPLSESLTPEDTAAWARISGVFWAAFVLFAWTAGSILSGALIERITSGAFWILAVLIGSTTWVIGGAWGWSPDGWMVQLLGYHDAYASGVIHAVCGGAALGILIQLGPRVGRFRDDGTARVFPLRNQWLVIIGLFLIYTGFWGFYAACNIPIIEIQSDAGTTYFTATTIYLTPTTLGASTVNFLMSLCGGLFAGYWVSRGDPFWTFSGGLAGIITASSGNDVYHPLQAFLLGAAGVWCAHKLHYFVERRFQIDDAVGAVAVHGYCGVIGVVACGFLLWGYPSSPNPDYARITPWGQIAGAVIMFGVLGFLPGYLGAGVLKRFGILRIPIEVELVGLDYDTNLEAVEQAAEIVASERELLGGASVLLPQRGDKS